MEVEPKNEYNPDLDNLLVVDNCKKKSKRIEQNA